ncbi:MAG: dihydropteroate synthase, partial [Candidatus Acidiferrum sp.]
MRPRKKFRLKLPSRTLILGERTLVMGVLNVTPDSFSDGGNYEEPGIAIEHALAMEHDGADLIDVGGESTRPGSEEIPASEELDRILPVLEGLRGRLKIPISVDTRRSTIAELAIRAGAEIINDVSGLKSDARIAEVAAKNGVPLILVHMRGEPRTMQAEPFARDVIRDVMRGLGDSAANAQKAGVAQSQIIVDPGIGFGKSHSQNYELLQKLQLLAALGYPLLVGASRKGFLGATLAHDGK